MSAIKTWSYLRAAKDFQEQQHHRLLQYAAVPRFRPSVDIGIGISGIAGPTGDTPEKPIGLVFIGYSTEKETYAKKYNFETDRITFKKMVLEEIISFLEEFL